MNIAVNWREKAGDAHRAGNLEQAKQAYQNWLIESPSDPDALHGMGACLIAEGQNDAACETFEKALTQAPHNASIRRNLGVSYWVLNRRSEALAMLEESDRLEPKNPHTVFNLAVACMGFGHRPRAMELYRECLTLDPKHALAHSNLIYMLDLLGDDAEAVEERHRFEEQHGPAAREKWQPHPNPKKTDRRLKIGYVSGDFQFHSASFAFRPVLLHHDRDQFEIFCYSATTRHDQTTQWFRDEFRWRNLGQLPPDMLVEGIRRDGIDILVDLSGHSRENRLLTFALKPAPVQVTAWGHALGTGLKAMDYLFSDPRVLPLERRALFAETVVDLPSVVCFEPQTPAPEILPLVDRPPTFGAFHRLEKISEVTLDMWSAVLKAVRGSRLVIKCPDFEDPVFRTRMHESFSARSIDPARVELRGTTVHYQHLTQMNDLDVMLDTFPHGGGISAIESLWMGVPIVTRRGVNIASRLAASFNALVGLDDCVATGHDSFVAAAKTQIGARAYLTEQRATLRDKLLQSPLCDHAGYAKAVEERYREMWERWCAHDPDADRRAAGRHRIRLDHSNDYNGNPVGESTDATWQGRHMKPGHCAVCDTPTWRMAFDPGAGDILLWPKPESVYACVRHEGLDSTGSAHARSSRSAFPIARGARPRSGDLSLAVHGAIEVVELERAKTRYASWYTPKHGEWLRAHARDQLKMDDVAIEKLLKQWEADRTWVG